MRRHLNFGSPASMTAKIMQSPARRRIGQGAYLNMAARRDDAQGSGPAEKRMPSDRQSRRPSRTAPVRVREPGQDRPMFTFFGGL